jgi:uncharacterized protein (TIGR03083 family)
VGETSIGARLLLAERDALLPDLRAAAPADFDRSTVLPGWSVRDVLAHCAAALTTAAAGTRHSFSPEDNQRDVDEREPWTIEALLEELSGGCAAAAAMDAAGGRLDLTSPRNRCPTVRNAVPRRDGYHRHRDGHDDR